MGAYLWQQYNYCRDTISRAINTHIAGLGIRAIRLPWRQVAPTMTPGDSGMTLRGTRVSLDSTGEFVLCSQKIALEGARGGSGEDELIATVAGQGLTRWQQK
ncbi:hypothetical protein N7G274_008997 [Stereocaulon virgatum]|uniref:Uncharacterized protein n=1 Tax=Stereocaulon virgatum TaxID=373712 RepID=A0ABR4A4R5_9LECA